MNDEHLEKALNSIRDTYRVPPEPPLETMWTAIDEQLAQSPRQWSMARRGTSWALVGLAAAAALVVGVGVGRWSAPSASFGEQPVAVATSESRQPSMSLVADVTSPLPRTTTTYLTSAEALLRELQDDPNGVYATQAATLLTKTRLLLDSPAATNQRMQTLLEDLELVLAQIAMLRQDGPSGRRLQDVEMIRSALNERDMVSRVRTAVVSLAADED